VTWLTVEAATEVGIKGVVIGKDATVRVQLSGGSPTGIYSSLT
jgi:hypothetical protein